VGTGVILRWLLFVFEGGPPRVGNSLSYFTSGGAIRACDAGSRVAGGKGRSSPISLKALEVSCEKYAATRTGNAQDCLS
jgi:hypothetical protein